MSDEPRQRTLKRVEALNGVGFAERNLGNQPAAEEAYLASLRLSPSATTHAQLSGVYDDAQNVGLALAHAQAAAELDPSRSSAVGELRQKASRYRFCRPGD